MEKFHHEESFNVALIGFMATGKSTVGALLAQRTNKIFIESDEEIEKKVGIPLSRFVKENELEFRKMEQNFCKKLHQYSDIILSCGGGIVIHPENVQNLRKYCFVFGLEASLDSICARVLKDGIETRPLVDVLHPRESLESILNIRAPLYKKAAHFTVKINNLTPDEIVNIIMKKIQEMKNDK